MTSPSFAIYRIIASVDILELKSPLEKLETLAQCFLISICFYVQGCGKCLVMSQNDPCIGSDHP